MFTACQFETVYQFVHTLPTQDEILQSQSFCVQILNLTIPSLSAYQSKMATRTTFRMNYKDFKAMAADGRSGPSAPAPRPEGTIYHVLTETPSIKDYTAFGPFECIEATVPSIINKLKFMSPPGLTAFEDSLPEWISGSIVHVKAPLGDGNHTLIRLVKEHNPTVAAALPGPAWVVKRAQANLKNDHKNLGFNIVGSYLQREQAFAAARNDMSQLLTADPAARPKEPINKSKHLAILAASNGIGYLVEATFDSGATVDGRNNNRPIAGGRKSSVAICAGCGDQSGEDGSPLKKRQVQAGSLLWAGLSES